MLNFRMVCMGNTNCVYSAHKWEYMDCVFVYLLGDRIKNTLDSLCMKDGHIAANAFSSYLLHNL